MQERNWKLYIIETECGRLYTGVTTDLERRFGEHKASKKGAKFFRGAVPKKIVYALGQLSRSEALKREAFIKKLPRKKKLELIQGLELDALMDR